MSFALELAQRFLAQDQFHRDFDALQAEAALSTLSGKVQPASAPLNAAAIHRLLYCASVFVQTDDEELRALAQSIALGSLLARNSDTAPENGLRLLTDLGNFPALDYAEAHHANGGSGLRQSLRAALSRELNAFSVGGEHLALTDFQKRAWERLHSANTLAISAPTSAGKSFLVIEHLCRLAEQADTFAAVYVAPTRALLSEVYNAIQRRLGSRDVRISTVPTASGSTITRQLFVLTQERLQVLLAVTDLSFDLVVVDEAQNFSDGARGMILQDCIEQMMSRSSATQLVMLAPGAQGFRELGFAIGAEDLEAAASLLPSVIQNRIVASPGRGPKSLKLQMMTANGMISLGELQGDRGFHHPESRLAAIALQLGGDGGSLVYATGPKQAERIASQLIIGRSDATDGPLAELSKFIAEHIHPQYGLARLVRRGVAFHYGKMPTLLREAIETAFKAGDLKFLVCTTTLFQGVNLPARNVFIHTSTRGQGNELDPAALWNFAGRAGRMKRDVVGNVFLVDYEDWPQRPMDAFVGYKIEPAFGRTAQDHTANLIAALSGEMPRPSPRDETPVKIRAAAGLLISRAARGDVRAFLQRTLVGASAGVRDELATAAEKARDVIELPSSLLATNWTVDPFGLKRLHAFLVAQIEADNADAMIPVSPLISPKTARDDYATLFKRIEGRVNLGAGWLPEVAALPAVQWMEGMRYPVILSSALKRANLRYRRLLKEYEEVREANPKTRKRPPPEPDINDVIHDTFSLIEDVIRFRYVQLGKAYHDILVRALSETGNEHRIGEIFDFALALELGISTRSGWSFMELGLSRIAATALEPHFPDSEMSVETARDWLWSEDLSPFNLGPIVIAELRRLQLVPTIEAADADDGEVDLDDLLG